MLCLRKIKQQGGLALILSHVAGGCLLASAEIFPEFRNADLSFRHGANCPPVASPTASSTSHPQCVSQGFCFHFDIWTESLVLLWMSKFLWLFVSGLLMFLPCYPFRGVNFYWFCGFDLLWRSDPGSGLMPWWWTGPCCEANVISSIV